ncbi:MAG TPA: MarR family winged helix-turn-helix transcriptional regulator [Steroidobacteraceae bacterium]
MRVSLISRALSQQMLLYVRREFGLNLAEYRTLTVLGENRSASIRDIAFGTQFDKAQVVRAVASLTRRRLAVQMVHGSDRRLRVVKLTAAGRSLLDKILPFSIARQQRLEKRLSAAELRVVWKALDVLTEEAQAMLAEEVERSAARPRKPAQK